MNYYIDTNVRKIVVKGVPVIGNVKNGSFILLNKNGARLIEKIEQNESIQESILDENLQELLNVALESDILHKSMGDTVEETKKGIYSAYVHVTHRCNMQRKI